MSSNCDIVPQGEMSRFSDLNYLPSEHAPYLLYLSCNIDKNLGDDVFTFFSIRTGRCFQRRIPALSGKVFIGCQYGWLATVNSVCELSLINPISEEEIILPSLTTLPTMRTSYDADGSIDAYLYNQFPLSFDRFQFDELYCGISFRRLVVSSEPSTLSHSFTVAAIVGSPPYIAIAREGQSNWILIKDKEYADLCFNKDGSIICLTCQGAVQKIKFDHDAGIAIEEIAPCLPDEIVDGNMYIVHNDQGELFIILRSEEIGDGPNAGVDTVGVQVLKLTIDDKEVKTWTPIRSLAGRAIFLGANAFMILSPEEVSCEIQPNCIYFTDDWWDYMIDEDDLAARRDLVVYNLQYDRIDRIICPIENVLSCWPLPIWFC